jgi:hypothetical protein
MRKYFCIILALLPVCGVLSAQSAGAQEAPSAAPATVRLSPDEAVDRAVNNNLGLESARVTAGTRRRASELSWNQFVPSVTVGGSLIMDNEKSTVSGMAPVTWEDVQKAGIPGLNQSDFEIKPLKSGEIPGNEGKGLMSHWILFLLINILMRPGETKTLKNEDIRFLYRFITLGVKGFEL